MFIMDIGGHPIGEVFMSTPGSGRYGAGDETFFIAHYYDGTEVKMLKFKKPIEDPESGSLMQRIHILEDRQEQLLRIVGTLCGFHLPAMASDQAWCNENYADLKSFNDNVRGRSVKYPIHDTDSPFMVMNYETLRIDRGWKE